MIGSPMPPAHDVDIANIKSEIRAMKLVHQTMTDDIKEIREGQKELLEAWRAAGRLLGFVKMLAGFVTAVAAAWLIVKQIWTG